MYGSVTTNISYNTISTNPIIQCIGRYWQSLGIEIGWKIPYRRTPYTVIIYSTSNPQKIQEHENSWGKVAATGTKTVGTFSRLYLMIMYIYGPFFI